MINKNDFLTLRKEFYNFYLNKLSTKVFRFYQKSYYPPTIDYVMNPQDSNRILEKLPKVLNLEIKEQSEEIKTRFAENIKIQESIMNIIKKRNEQFNYRAWLVKLKTWMWKSKVIIDITNYYQTNTLILVSNLKLMQEIKNKFIEFTNYTPKIYWWWKKEIWEITIMTKKSFTLDFESIKQEFNLIILDECHQQFTKNTYISINKFFHWKKWIALYWLSATPSTDFLEEKDLEKYFWKIITIQKEYDFIPEFIFYNYRPKNKFLYEYETYPELRQCLIDDIDRQELQFNIIKNNLSICSLILCDRLEEIENYYNNFKDEDIFLIKITGQTSILEDERLLNEALQQKKKILIIGSISKVSTGFDYPIIDTIFLFSSIKFENSVIQAVWRCLRKSQNKIWAKVIIWNDKALDKQRLQKTKTIYQEYWVLEKNIIINKI